MCIIRKLRIKFLSKKIKSMQAQRVHSQPSTDAILKEKILYYKLAKIYHSLIGKKAFPFASEMELECYRTAIQLEDIDAKFWVGQHLLEEAKFREQLQIQNIFASPSNERQMKQYYDEALAYLKSAAQLDHIQALRLLGLCYINGWGVSVDQDAGFDYIVKSIEKENSWDKVPQIFAAMGLNKPEFFGALMKRRR